MAIHPLAVVDPKAEIHPDAAIGPFCCIKGPVKIAAGVELHNNVTVMGRTTIGPGTKLFPNCVVGSDPQDLKYRGEDSETIVGSNSRIHEFVTISKGTAGGGMRTAIGNNCLIMAYAHIAHDCILSDHVVIGNNSQLAGHITIARKAIVSGMVGIHHFVSIGELSFVGAMSGVRTDVPPFVIVDGHPAEPRNVNIVGLRRDGMKDHEVRALKDAFRILFHDRKSQTLSEALAQAKETLPADSESPAQRLCAWLAEHLELSLKGRRLEAARPPVRMVGAVEDGR
jgi:UDP-N-acetylglucosamine acyltransferase